MVAAKGFRVLVRLVVIVGVIGLLFLVSARVSVYFEGLTKGEASDGLCDVCGANLRPATITYSVPQHNPNFNPGAMPNPITNPAYVNMPHTEVVPGSSPGSCRVYLDGMQVHEYCVWHGAMFALLHPVEAAYAAVPALGGLPQGRLAIDRPAAIPAACFWGFVVVFTLAVGLASSSAGRRKASRS